MEALSVVMFSNLVRPRPPLLMRAISLDAVMSPSCASWNREPRSRETSREEPGVQMMCETTRLMNDFLLGHVQMPVVAEKRTPQKSSTNLL